MKRFLLFYSFLCGCTLNISAQFSNIALSSQQIEVISYRAQKSFLRANQKTYKDIPTSTSTEVHFMVRDPEKIFFAGLHATSMNATTHMPAYCFYSEKEYLFIIENGILSGLYASVQKDDLLSIKRENINNRWVIQYYKNNIPIHAVVEDHPDVYKKALIKCPTTQSSTTLFPKDSLYVVPHILHAMPGQSTGSVDLSIFGGQPPYSIEWSDNSYTNYINALPTDVYHAWISDAEGNQSEYSFSIEQYVPTTLISPYGIDSSHRIVHTPVYSKKNTFLEGHTAIEKNADGAYTASFGKIRNTSTIEFGIKDKNASPTIEYGIRIENGILFAVQDGVNIKKIGMYTEGKPITVGRKNEAFYVRFGETNIYPFNSYHKEALTSMLSLSNASLNQWTVFSFRTERNSTDYYATLYKELDGSYYTMTNRVQFKYREKYDNQILSYRILDWERNEISGTTILTPHSYGTNYHSIKAWNVLNHDEMYILEVSDPKKEVYRMQFLFKKDIKIPAISTIGNWTGNDNVNVVKNPGGIVVVQPDTIVLPGIIKEGR